jgi:DNA-binding Lrp family transcriptional regulator
MFIDITKLDRAKVKEIVLAAGWGWDESRSLSAEEDRRDVERLVNEAYVRGFKVGVNSRTRIAEVVGAWEAQSELGNN